MIRLLCRLLAGLFPSVPPADQVRVLAAMEGRTQSPVPTSQGEGSVGTGQATGAAVSRAAGGRGGGPAPSGPAPDHTILSWGEPS